MKKVPRTNLGKLLVTQLMDSVRQRFQSVEKLQPVPHFAKATYLDPRCKKAAFGVLVNANEAESSVISEIAGLIQTENYGRH